MNRFFYMCMFSVILISCNQASKSPRDSSAEFKARFVKLSIHSIKVYEYEYLFGKANKSTEFLVEDTKLDEKGSTISSLIRVRSDSTNENSLNAYKYNEQGDMVEETDK